MIRVACYTSSRADFGLLKGLLRSLESDNEIDLHIICSGGHLDPKQGSTISEINLESFSQLHLVDTSHLSGQEEKIGVGLLKINELLDSLVPDLVLILGDRYELFSIAIPAFMKKISIVHFYGGDITKGSLDDSIRHALTKLSTLHLVSHRTNKERLLQLGEFSENVHVIGGLGLDEIEKINLKTRSELSGLFGFEFSQKNILITFHPDTTKDKPIDELIVLLDSLKSFQSVTKIFSYTNLDKTGDDFNILIEKFCSENKRSFAIKSFGRINYLSVMKICDCVVGNSSSGLLEAPSVLTPTINLGDRQDGRDKMPSVIDVPLEQNMIEEALQTVLFSQNNFDYRNSFLKTGSIPAAHRIIKNYNSKLNNFKFFSDAK